jgi:hypothetical protein
MKKLSDALKQMLAGLAHQDAGEFLPIRDKMRALGIETDTEGNSAALRNSANCVSGVKIVPATKRIALISDGGGMGAPLSYVIDSCQRLEGKIDLLIHGTTDADNISTLERQIEEAGIVFHRIQLGTKPVDGVLDYIRNHSALIFLVATPDDDVAKTLIEEVIPKQGAHIPLPIVLIEDLSPGHTPEKQAPQLNAYTVKSNAAFS